MNKKLLHVLETNPTKIINRILLIAGLVMFIPFYSYNYQLIMKIMDVDTLNTLLTSFNVNIFSDIMETIHEQGHSDTFFLIYVVNIISTTGFMLLGFSFTLIIARALIKNSILSKIGFYFPIFIIIIALLDFAASVLFLFIIKNLDSIYNWIVYTIDFCYIARIILLYLTFLWILITSVFIILKKVTNRKI